MSSYLNIIAAVSVLNNRPYAGREVVRKNYNNNIIRAKTPGYINQIGQDGIYVKWESKQALEFYQFEAVNDYMELF